MAEKNPTDIIREQHKTVEQLDHEHRNDAPGGSIPVTWKDGHTGAKLKGRPLNVIAPGADDISVFGRARASVCGQCKNYDLEGGRKQIIKQRLGERLVHEEQWQLHHLGDVDSLAICRETPTMAITYISPACDSFRPRAGRR